ncbi:C13 family peptidase [Gilvimarinus sp. SDUM040013]|uniref:C13 family peptidase n=1 Tax=Gilvimarinus gilvus TaxID=3058038 RepID=A0ABU4RV22_9GAMM|nr:C13 family peptidase [Gilvimarinus sp. SDUM040013]MDO3387055.1 C13 family peptidase [Gilvimarinus sp. SDUM040013]MDX6848051.1 C13 family peptidase [Gilvimarinus sp. SDUM040013]
MKLRIIALLMYCSMSACAHQEHATEQTVQLPDGAQYQGALVDGLLSGPGQLQWPNGDQYQGQFANGLISGQGRLTLADGDVFEGHFVEAKLHGQGRWQGSDGASYSGGFQNDEFHGEGVYKSDDGDVYTGEFVDGELTGLGTYESSDGTSYAGEFRAWRYHGAGVWQGEGQRYTGEFEEGYFHGFGELVNTETGEVEKSGQWRWGRQQASAEQKADKKHRRAEFEQALLNQSARLEQSLSQVHASRPGEVDMFALLVAGDGTQTVFDSEVRVVAEKLQERYGVLEHRVILSNLPDSVQDYPLATRHNIQSTLTRLSELMQLDEDILLIYMTSHGSDDFEFSLKSPQHNFVDIDLQDWQSWLKESPIKWQVVMVSACYSGGVVPALEGDTALVMTAAADDKTSFGCGDNDTMTYFGRAIFEQSLAKAPGLVEAFDMAKELISEWEQEQDFTPSEPQISAGQAMVDKLSDWEQRRP